MFAAEKGPKKKTRARGKGKGKGVKLVSTTIASLYRDGLELEAREDEEEDRLEVETPLT
jgi:hypothetical protein